jgi:hypothetical protein
MQQHLQTQHRVTGVLKIKTPPQLKPPAKILEIFYTNKTPARFGAKRRKILGIFGQIN